MHCPHCKTEIDEHEAGRKTDVCVAVVVMGWKQSDQGPRDPENWRSYPDEWYEKPDGHLENVTNVPEFSTSIAAAWDVVGRLPYYVVLRREDTRESIVGEYAGDWRCSLGYAGSFPYDVTWEIVAPTAPLAICCAALKSV